MPVIYDNGITYRPKLSSLFTDGAGNSGTLHFTLGVDDLNGFHVRQFSTRMAWINYGQYWRSMGACRSETYNTGIVLEVEVDAVRSAPGLALADNDSGHNLLTKLGLSLLDGGHDHITDTGGGETVQTRTNALDGDDVEVTGTGVVAAVEDGAAV